MATPHFVTDTKKFDEMIADVITDLRRKHKHADCESVRKEIVKLADFSDDSKKDLMNRINTLLIDGKILMKKIETQTFTTSMKIYPQTIITSLITKKGSTSINPIPEFTIGSASPDGQNLNIDPISEKLKFKILKTTFYKISAKVL